MQLFVNEANRPTNNHVPGTGPGNLRKPNKMKPKSLLPGLAIVAGTLTATAKMSSDFKHDAHHRYYYNEHFSCMTQEWNGTSSGGEDVEGDSAGGNTKCNYPEIKE